MNVSWNMSEGTAEPQISNLKPQKWIIAEPHDCLNAWLPGYMFESRLQSSKSVKDC